MDFHIPFATYRLRHKRKLAALYHALRDGIAAGKIAPLTKLPASRELAVMYGLSRGTVNQAYEMLTADGYVQAEVGRGTFVTYSGRWTDVPATAAVKLSSWGVRVSGAEAGGEQEQEREHGQERGRGREQEQERGCESANGWHAGGSNVTSDAVAFDQVQPDLRHFPWPEWNRLMFAEVRRLREQPHEEAPAEGDAALREAVALHLRRMRGIDAPPERVVIVNGSMQAIALLTHLLVEPGDPVIVERPGYLGIERAVRAVGGCPVPGVVDGHGLVPQPWAARLLFVTPGRQFPTGAVLAPERRQALLRWAAEREALIVEDDYDSEFRHRGRPLEPLKALDREGRVVHLGTFSKTMLRQLRIGYAVLPEPLVAPFSRAKRLFEPYPAGLLEQRTLAAFMQSGGYERHLRRMRRVYASKFFLLKGLLQEHLSSLFDWVESDAGLHLFGWWRGDAATFSAYAAVCRQAGAAWETTMPPAGEAGRYGARFGFSHLSEEQLRHGVGVLCEVWARRQAWL
ncbi:PLP-dependent aminotransferase family protein [Paenibacillus athensensis]|uniref:HTH gntR-type domain-containing protein n=1 Tax=Paenibacillus athensensis TaxID=1967502 RepID=A0A4Y8PXG2_9BACL|nr:PLP-dependent aminotransferase family protein [Paenibacillus athensensis]MCD1258042.1 PLP-dependent aminotransferase family protein [Paenibacillus athensensis]